MKLILSVLLFTILVIKGDKDVGLVYSGGGIRAMVGCVGVLKAFDDKMDEVLSVTGLSGGSWSVALQNNNNFHYHLTVEKIKNFGDNLGKFNTWDSQTHALRSHSCDIQHDTLKVWSQEVTLLMAALGVEGAKKDIFDNDRGIKTQIQVDEYLECSFNPLGTNIDPRLAHGANFIFTANEITKFDSTSTNVRILNGIPGHDWVGEEYGYNEVFRKGAQISPYQVLALSSSAYNEICDGGFSLNDVEIDRRDYILTDPGGVCNLPFLGSFINGERYVINFDMTYLRGRFSNSASDVEFDKCNYVWKLDELYDHKRLRMTLNHDKTGLIESKGGKMVLIVSKLRSAFNFELPRLLFWVPLHGLVDDEIVKVGIPTTTSTLGVNYFETNQEAMVFIEQIANLYQLIKLVIFDYISHDRRQKAPSHDPSKFIIKKGVIDCFGVPCSVDVVDDNHIRYAFTNCEVGAQISNPNARTVIGVYSYRKTHDESKYNSEDELCCCSVEMKTCVC